MMVSLNAIRLMNDWFQNTMLRDYFLRRIFVPAFLVLVPSEAYPEMRIWVGIVFQQTEVENKLGREGSSKEWVNKVVFMVGNWTLIPQEHLFTSFISTYETSEQMWTNYKYTFIHLPVTENCHYIF